MDPVTTEGIKNHEAHISRAVMQVISSAKDLSPSLYELPEQQEKIINACRDAAKIVFEFRSAIKEQIESALDSAKMGESTRSVEKAIQALSQTVKETNAEKVNNAGFGVFIEKYFFQQYNAYL